MTQRLVSDIYHIALSRVYHVLCTTVLLNIIYVWLPLVQLLRIIYNNRSIRWLSSKEQVTVLGQIRLHKETNGIKNPSRRISARRNQWHQELAKNNYSKNYQASRICQEELQQEIPLVKNRPRRNTARRRPMESRICQEDTEEETNGIKNLPRRI